MAVAVDVPQLLEMSPNELATLFRSSPAGEIPVGKMHGTVLVAPGTEIAGPAKKFAQLLVWQGKIFDPVKADLRNLILPFGIKAVRAKVYKDASWFDEQETIVLDYSKTSFVAKKIRDEIREVSPGVYLGLVFWGRSMILHFALTQPD
jgi:hypothetical protein